MSYEKIKTILKDIDSIPYPQINYLNRNSYFANMLYNSYAGEYSELSATTQYIYEHINIIRNPMISEIMKIVAIVEMKHLNILGDLLRKLGNSPCYMDSNNKYWTSNYLNYSINDIIKLMEYNIKSEKEAIDQYNKIILYSRNPSITRLFQRIILDEKTHIKVFNEIINEYSSKK